MSLRPLRPGDRARIIAPDFLWRQEVAVIIARNEHGGWLVVVERPKDSQYISYDLKREYILIDKEMELICNGLDVMLELV